MAFTWFDKFGDVWERIPDGESRDLFAAAVVQYGMTGEVRDLPWPLDAMLAATLDDVDNSRSARRRGSRGGRPRATGGSEKPEVSENEKPEVSGSEKPEVPENPKPNTSQDKTSQVKSEGQEHGRADGRRARAGEVAMAAVGRLNERAGTSFRPTSRRTVGLVSARLAEGFSEADFLRVVDHKARSWLGTDMARYLRPETLFGPKFEGYLNEPEGRASPRPGEYGIEGDDPFAAPAGALVVGGGAS